VIKTKGIGSAEHRRIWEKSYIHIPLPDLLLQVIPKKVQQIHGFTSQISAFQPGDRDPRGSWSIFGGVVNRYFMHKAVLHLL